MKPLANLGFPEIPEWSQNDSGTDPASLVPKSQIPLGSGIGTNRDFLNWETWGLYQPKRCALLSEGMEPFSVPAPLNFRHSKSEKPNLFAGNTSAIRIIGQPRGWKSPRKPRTPAQTPASCIPTPTSISQRSNGFKGDSERFNKRQIFTIEGGAGIKPPAPLQGTNPPAAASDPPRPPGVRNLLGVRPQRGLCTCSQNERMSAVFFLAPRCHTCLISTSQRAAPHGVSWVAGLFSVPQKGAAKLLPGSPRRSPRAVLRRFALPALRARGGSPCSCPSTSSPRGRLPRRSS